MGNRLGTIAISIAVCGITVLLLCLDAYKYDDGIEMQLAPKLAEVLGLISDSHKSEPSFRPDNGLSLSEATAIYVVGAFGITLGFISVILGFFSIKKGESSSISYGAIALGVAPIILVSIKIALACFLFVGLTALWYKKSVNNTSNQRDSADC